MTIPIPKLIGYFARPTTKRTNWPRAEVAAEILAGGGFNQSQHLAFDTMNNYPLSNLYVSMLQRLGIEADTFSTSKGTMRGLEIA